MFLTNSTKTIAVVKQYENTFYLTVCRLFFTPHDMNFIDVDNFCKANGGEIYTKNSRVTLEDVAKFMSSYESKIT